MGLFNKLFGDKQDEEKQSSEALALEEKQDMIKGIEDLSETSVKEVMIPRIDVDFLSLGTPQEELLEKIAESGHSRFPVYSESIDNVVGVLYVKDLINAFSKKETIDFKNLRNELYDDFEKKLAYAEERGDFKEDDKKAKKELDDFLNSILLWGDE